ncbi:MAG: MlaD family protein [Solirubrobacteraceae bacterium]|nr:MlaD family protein [Solirubrobacteraceae bacterium]
MSDSPVTPRPGTGLRRLIPVVLVALVALLVWATVLRSDGADYELNAQFSNAGQLVTGARVEVAGVQIGKVEEISIADGGLANVKMRITDDRFAPLREGTRASIRSVGQATITNRFIDIGPGPSNAPELPDGALIARDDTAGIVDLDAVLNSFDPDTRKQLARLIEHGAEVYAGSSGEDFNRMLAELDPALESVHGLVRDLAADQQAITQLVRDGSTAARAVASRRTQLETAVVKTADTLEAVAGESEALSDVLRRAPSVLRQAGGTLRSAASTVDDLRPTLRAVPEPQAQLRLLLRRLPIALRRTDSTAARLDALVPDVDVALGRIPALEEPLVSGIRDVSQGLKVSMPMLEGLRFYGSDLILGVVNGLISIGTGQYHIHGHYLKMEFVQTVQTALGGALSPLLGALTGSNDFIPGLINATTRQTNRCPGGNAPPAPDGSNPWYPKEGICDPTMSMSSEVNSPTAFCRTFSDCDGDRRSLAPEPEVVRSRTEGSR